MGFELGMMKAGIMAYLEAIMSCLGFSNELVRLMSDDSLHIIASKQ
jgi:hypothetical protein